MGRNAAVALLLAAVIGTAACGGNSLGGTTAAEPATVPTVTAAPVPHVAGVPPEVIANVNAWALPGQNYDNSRAASLSSITSANVSRLKPRWVARPSGIGALSTVPIVTADTVYLQGGTGEVVAIDRATGKTRWTHATAFNIGPFGVAIGNGRIYADDGSNGIVALAAKTGEVLWHRRITTTKSLGVDIQPTVFGGTVFAATVPVSLQGIFAGGDAGKIYAINAATGKVRWSFDTVKGNLWGHPEVNSGGGAWYPPAIDVRRRVVYFGTGNPAPFPGTSKYPNGSSRPGPNLYTDSIVALNLDTGKLLWYHQVTAHDIFDYDQMHTMLVTTNQGRRLVISAGKAGVVVALDPTTGKVSWQRAIGQHHNDHLKALHGPTSIAPGTFGGIETPPASADGTAYFATVNAPTTLQPNKVLYFGAHMGQHPGEVVAIDLATGRVRWDTKVPGDPLSGAMVVNNLVFTALYQGTVVALNRTTGKVVWRYKTKGGINGWLSADRDTVYVPVGQANPPQILALSVDGR